MSPLGSERPQPEPEGLNYARRRDCLKSTLCVNNVCCTWDCPLIASASRTTCIKYCLHYNSSDALVSSPVGDLLADCNGMVD